MAQGPKEKEVHVSTPTNQINNPGTPATNALAGAAVVVLGSPVNKTAIVQGQIPGTSVVFSNPA